MKKNGFTLIELLFVVGILLLMAAILTPFVQMAKDRSHRIDCANNLRKISLGLHMYAADHGDAFPPNLDVLHPNYVDDEKTFDCPASKSIGTKDKPDYNYSKGLTEASSGKETIVQDIDNNHNKSGRNVLRINGSVGWIR